MKNQSGSCLYCHICEFHFHTHSILAHHPFILICVPEPKSVTVSAWSQQGGDPGFDIPSPSYKDAQADSNTRVFAPLAKTQVDQTVWSKHWGGWSRTMTSKGPNTFKVKDHGIPKQMTKDHCIPRNIIYQGRWHWWLKSTRTPPSINCHWRVCYVIQIGNLGVILLLAKVVTLLCRTALRESRLQGQFLPFWSHKCFTDYRPLVFWRLSMLQRWEEDFFCREDLLSWNIFFLSEPSLPSLQQVPLCVV